MKVIKIGIISLIIIVSIIGVAIPVPTEIGEGYDTLKETIDAQRAIMRNLALATTIIGLIVLVTMAFAADDKFAKYTYAITITILLFSVFSDFAELMYLAIIIAVVFMTYDVIVNEAYEKEEEAYESRIKNVAAHKLALNEKRKKLFKDDLSEMRTKKKSSHKERL